jgi:hypothetical protein
MKWAKFLIALIGVVMLYICLDVLVPNGNVAYLIGMWLGANLFIGAFTLEDEIVE